MERPKGASPKIAALGCGLWGQNIVRNLDELGALAAVVDTDVSKARDLSERYSVPAFRSVAELLEEVTLDGVTIATPADTHAELAVTALDHGLDVFVEKPMATCVADGERMVQIAAERDRVLMVGHLLEYHGAVLRLKDLVDSGELGHIEYIYSNRLNVASARREENALWSFAPHDIAISLLLVGEMPSRVTATGGPDVTVTNLLFEGGLRAHIFVSWLHPFKEQKLVVTGSRKMAVFNDVVPENKLLVYDRNIVDTEQELVAHRVSGAPIEYDRTEPLQKECQHFIDCVRGLEKPRTCGLNGLKVLSVLQASQACISHCG